MIRPLPLGQRWSILGMVVWLLVLLSWSPLAQAQVEAIRLLPIRAEDIGVGGVFRAGHWTALLINVENLSNQPREVIAQWELGDSDGDHVICERTVTLSPQRSQQFFLHAQVAMHTSPQTIWEIRLLDVKTRRLLAAEKLSPLANNLLDPREMTIGLTSGTRCGLDSFETPWTQHEAVRPVVALDPARLPDRWYSLSALDALVWTPQSTPPDDPSIPAESLRAVKEWVQAGGHLVVVLSATGDAWSSSPLGSLLPNLSTRVISDLDPPTWLGIPQRQEDSRIEARVLQPIGARAGQVAILFTDPQQQPLVVAHTVGLGRVTVIGIDLSDVRLTRQLLPNHNGNLWQRIFGWQGMSLSTTFAQAQASNLQITRPDQRRTYELGGFLARLISMRETAASAILLAILAFGIYWFVAGPISFMILKWRKLTQHAWTAFVITVLIFSVVTWGGASLLRPADRNLAHFSVVDVNDNEQLAHIQSWMSLYSPDHGSMTVSLRGDKRPLNQSILGSPGLSRSLETGFFDPRSYNVQATAPDQLDVPMRATAKMLEAQQLVSLRDFQIDTAQPWVMPQGPLTLDRTTAWPVGKLSHGLPGTLRDVLIVYVAGGEFPTFVWRHGNWPSQTVLELGERKGQPLIIPARFPLSDKPEERLWRGHLGDLLSQRPAEELENLHDTKTLSTDRMIQLIEALTFYQVLPPPDVKNTDFRNLTVSYTREFGRSLDLSSWLTQRRLIIIGHLENSPLPLPLKAEGQTVRASGWTVVRWTRLLE